MNLGYSVHHPLRELVEKEQQEIKRLLKENYLSQKAFQEEIRTRFKSMQEMVLTVIPSYVYNIKNMGGEFNYLSHGGEHFLLGDDPKYLGEDKSLEGKIHRMFEKKDPTILIYTQDAERGRHVSDIMIVREDLVREFVKKIKEIERLKKEASGKELISPTVFLYKGEYFKLRFTQLIPEGGVKVDEPGDHPYYNPPPAML